MDDLFPLTPALSLRERGSCRQTLELCKGFGSTGSRLRFSLSLRERAGGRGKGASDIQVRSGTQMGPLQNLRRNFSWFLAAHNL